MPFIQKTYNHTADSYTLLDTPSVLNYPEYAVEDNTGTLKSIAKITHVAGYVNTSGWGTFTNIFLHTEGTSIFYQDLKQILSALDDKILSIQFEDSNFSFTIFDTTFYIRALNLFDNAASGASTNIQCGLSIPVVYRKGKIVTPGWSCNRSISMHITMWSSPSYGYNNQTNIQSNTTSKMSSIRSFSKGAYSSITTQNKLQYIYTIKIRYNTNFLHISYENWNGNEIPLLFVMQGQDINQKNVVFTTLGGAVNSRWYNFNTISLDAITHVVNGNLNEGEKSHTNEASQWPNLNAFTYFGHHIEPLYDLFYPGGKDITGAININPYCLFSNLYATTKPYCFGLYSLARSDNTLLTKPICINGFIDFDNVYYAPSGLQKWNANYEINGEQYWCMGSYMRDTIANWSNLAYNTTYWQLYYDFSFLLKL